MIIDYKINRIVRTGATTSISIIIYRGDFQNVSQINPETKQNEIVSQYVRTARIATREFSRPGNFTDAQIRVYVNNRLKEIRDANYPALSFLSDQDKYV